MRAQLGRQVEPRLAPQVGDDGIGPLLFNNLLQGLNRERLDVCDIGHARVRHDGSWVGIDENDLITQLPQGLAGLGPRAVELPGLADDDGH